jgi:UPF0716 protein FxsA
MTVLLFIFLEIAGLLIVGSWIGVGWTLMLLLGGFVLGLALIGRGGRAAMAAVNQTARSRQVGNTTVTGGFLTVVAGALLMIPGFITDVAALALLLPPIRTLVRRRTQAWAQRQSASIQVVNLSDMPVGTWDGAAGPRMGSRIADNTVDGTVVEVTDDDRSRPAGSGGAVVPYRDPRVD